MQTTDTKILSSAEISKYRETLMNLDAVILDTSLLVAEKTPADRSAHQHVLAAKELQRHFIYAPAPDDLLSALDAINSVLGILDLAREVTGTEKLKALTELSGS